VLDTGTHHSIVSVGATNVVYNKKKKEVRVGILLRK